MRGVGLVVIGVGIAGVLAGCKPTWFDSRGPWRAEAEQQCLKSGAVKESAAVALLRPISGPGVCGADFPLKVAALGEGNVLGFADELRPPGLIPQARRLLTRAPPVSSYPQPGPPAYPNAPISVAPPPGRAVIERGGYQAPDPMMSESGSPTYQRPRVYSRPAPAPEPVYQPEPDEYEPEPDPPRYDPRAQERWREPPRTAAPAPPPRAAPVPLGRSRIPINATAVCNPRRRSPVRSCRRSSAGS